MKSIRFRGVRAYFRNPGAPRRTSRAHADTDSMKAIPANGGAGRTCRQGRPHQQVLIEVWGSEPSYSKQVRYQRIYMGQLRQKQEAYPAQPRYLPTEYGVEYQVKE